MLLDQINVSEEEAFELAYKNSCTKGMLQEAEVFRTMAMLRKVDRFPIPGTFGILIAKRVWCKYHAESGIFENGI